MSNYQFRTGLVVGGNSLYPSIEHIADHVGTRSYVSFFSVKLFPTSFPRFVLMFFYLAFMCPHLYWAEYFYVAIVVKVFLINLLCILFM